MQYVELHCKSNFSFLHGAAHPEELVQQASELGYAGLAITDRESVAGVVRGFTPAKELALPYIVGAEINPTDGPPLVLWPTDRSAYGRMCHLISRGRLRAEKGQCELRWEDVAEFSDGILVGVAPPDQHDVAYDGNLDLEAIASEFGDRAYLLCELHRGVDDRRAVHHQPGRRHDAGHRGFRDR